VSTCKSKQINRGGERGVPALASSFEPCGPCGCALSFPSHGSQFRPCVPELVWSSLFHWQLRILSVRGRGRGKHWSDQELAWGVGVWGIGQEGQPDLGKVQVRKSEPCSLGSADIRSQVRQAVLGCSHSPMFTRSPGTLSLPDTTGSRRRCCQNTSCAE
jgi:hypothetical protein